MREGGGAGYDLAHAQVAAGQNCGIARRRHADDASKSDGSEMQLAARGMRVRENALGGLQHVAAVYFFELKSPATRCRSITRRILKKSLREAAA